MPTLVQKRSKKVYLASVMVKGQRSQKQFPPTVKGKRDAGTWEAEERKRLRKIRTEFLTLRIWTNDYLTEIQRLKYSVKTYKEKRSAFIRLAAFKDANPEMPLDIINRYLAKAFLDNEFDNRPGNAVNKDRKNLSAGWCWGMNTVRGWPKGENPFKAVPKYPAEKHPTYVPPVPDYWTLYDYLAGLAESGKPGDIQNRVMIAAYLNLAARRSEVFRLKLNDLDFIQNRVRLWTRKRESRQLEPDWLPMTTELRKELRQWVEIRFQLPTEDREHVFVCLDTLPCTEHFYGKPFKQRRHIMAKWCKRAKVKHFGFHAIRHLTATILYQKGNFLQDDPVAAIQSILRHQSPNTTVKYLKSLGLTRLKDNLEDGLKREPGKAEIIQLNQKKTASNGMI